MAAEASASPVALQLGKGSREPRYLSFTQQQLPAIRPLTTPVWVIAIFLAAGIGLLPIGAACLSAALSVKELSADYDKVCVVGNSNAERDAALQQMNGNGTLCQVQLRPTALMRAPIYVYFELDNFYQNHRRFVKSRDDGQLRGEARLPADMGDCAPQLYLDSNQSAVIRPCGLVAWSLFNDTYTMEMDGQDLPITSTGIAWGTDLRAKFSSTAQPTNFNSEPRRRGGAQLPAAGLNTDERLVVWMRTAALPHFRRLWGIISLDLQPESTVTVSIVNAYNTYRFGGSKKVVLSTASWIGGRNTFLGIAYLVVGGISVLCSLLCLAIALILPRPVGDTSQLSFAKHHTL